MSKLSDVLDRLERVKSLALETGATRPYGNEVAYLENNNRLIAEYAILEYILTEESKL